MIKTFQQFLEDANLIDMFSHGYCQEYALALHDITKAPLMSVVAVSGNLMDFAHAFVQVAPNMGRDALGIRPFATILQWNEQERPLKDGVYKIKPITRNQLLKSTGSTGIDEEWLNKALKSIKNPV